MGKLALARQGLGRRVGDSVRSMGYNASQKAIKGVKKLPGKAFRTARRAGIGAFTGGAAALAALGVGATMSPEKAMALTATAFSAGSNFGNFYGDKLAGAGGDIAKGGAQAFWGSDYKKIQQSKFDKEFMAAPETIDALTKSLGSRDAAIAAINDGSVQALLSKNHTDAAKIGKALSKRGNYLEAAKAQAMARGASEADAQKIAEQQSLERVIGLANWARDINPGVFNPNSREQLAWKNTITRQLVASGVSPSAATKRVEEVLDEMEDIYSA
ncbi:MAG: hypothetical protein HFJ24_02000 [Clostridia bacterium]|nr:hypothetical protein [Clostridia bacterium]MCI9274821.1 hypothetical protein [Clostridia bacterium]